jgi:site-specific DNA recombinase
MQEKKQTIDSQVAALRAFAKGRGDTVAEHAVFLDEGVSGATLERRGLDRLRDAAEARQFDAVAVFSPDRLSRKYAYLVLLLEQFERLGIPVLFVEQPPGDDPHTILLTQIQGAVAEYERAKLAERYRRGKLHRASQGEVFWTTVPYGYRHVRRHDRTPAHLVIDPDQAAIVRSIFRWHADELTSIRQIAKRLTRSGVRLPRGGRVWSETTIHRILHNHAYTGTLYYNRTQVVSGPSRALSRPTAAQERAHGRRHRNKEEWITLAIPPIVDRDLFERSQARHGWFTRFSPRRLKEERWLLRQLLRCGKCGYKYACVRTREPRPGQADSTYYYRYRCGRQSDSTARVRCARPHVQATALDEVVWGSICKHLLNPELLVKSHQQLPTNWMADDGFLELQVRTARQRLKQAEDERVRLLDAYQAGHLEKRELEVRAKKVGVRIKGLASELSTMEEERRRACGGRSLMNRIGEFTRTVTENLDVMRFHDRQALARTLLDEVVLEDRDVTLHLRIPLPRPSPAADVPKPEQPEGATSKGSPLRSLHDQNALKDTVWRVSVTYQLSPEQLCKLRPYTKKRVLVSKSGH